MAERDVTTQGRPQMRAGDGLHSPSPNIVHLFLEIALYLLTKHLHLQATTGHHNSQPHTCHSNQAWTLNFAGGGSGGSKRMTTMIPKIECPCSISRVVVAGAKGKPTTPEIKHLCSILGVAATSITTPEIEHEHLITGGGGLPLATATLNHPPPHPKSSVNAHSILGVVGFI